MIEKISIDLSNFCSKQCPFCYNHSRREGNTMWTTEEVISFACDCIEHGVKAVSLGGGEPFEYVGIFSIIDALYPKCYVSVTTNGLPLEDEEVWQQLLLHQPDKIHVTIHQPQSQHEVERVDSLIRRLAETNIKPGLNLLVGADKIDSAKAVYARFSEFLNPDQIILIPQRFSNTPTPKQLAEVLAVASVTASGCRTAGGQRFQSPSCLLGCKRSHDFVSVSWDKKVNFCSYAPCKQPLQELSFAGMEAALSRIEWKTCIS